MNDSTLFPSFTDSELKAIDIALGVFLVEGMAMGSSFEFNPQFFARVHDHLVDSLGGDLGMRVPFLKVVTFFSRFHRFQTVKGD